MSSKKVYIASMLSSAVAGRRVWGGAAFSDSTQYHRSRLMLQHSQNNGSGGGDNASPSPYTIRHASPAVTSASFDSCPESNAATLLGGV